GEEGPGRQGADAQRPGAEGRRVDRLAVRQEPKVAPRAVGPSVPLLDHLPSAPEERLLVVAPRLVGRAPRGGRVGQPGPGAELLVGLPEGNFAGVEGDLAARKFGGVARDLYR